MSRIPVVHHSKYIGYSGTDRVAQLFAKYLEQGGKYKPYILHRSIGAKDRLEEVRKFLPEDQIIEYHWKPGETGKTPPYVPEESDLFEHVRKIRPAVFHAHRSGYPEWPVTHDIKTGGCKVVETNIFGYPDRSGVVDCHLYISEYIKGLALMKGGVEGPVLYNPVELPVLDMTVENKQACRDALLDRFKLPRNAVLLGRVGRPANFDDISLRAFQSIEAEFDHVYYLVVAPCDGWRRTAEELGLKNVRFIDPIVGDDELSKFYHGLDIYAHARSDGECCPCNLQEAMMHSLVTVSHESMIYNGQAEIIEECGYVVPVADYAAYAEVLRELVINPALRVQMGREGRRRAMHDFEASVIGHHLERVYDAILAQ
jgi:glycosyltransferase involved in cell wall biosynthesis